MRAARWIWIGGWGLAPEWLREQAELTMPFAKHTVVPPSPTAIDEIDWGSFDRVGGYSLGSFLLLKNAAKISLPVLLLAPFFAYPAEAGLGGRIRQAQIRFLLRWLQRQPYTALADFYQRANLGLAAPDRLPYSIEDLEWGLQELAHEQVPPCLPTGWTGVIGDQDSLLDANILHAAQSTLQIVRKAGHHPALLMQAVSPI